MKIFAQEAPPAPEGMPTAPMAGGGPPAGPDPSAPPAPTFKVIYSPLDSLGKILADLDFKSYLQSNFGDNPDLLAHKIWVMYGGSENELSKGRTGERQETPASNDPTMQEQQQTQEYNATRNERWKRLPVGVSIDQITSPDSLSMAVQGGFANLSKPVEKAPTAKFINTWLKIAQQAEKTGDFKRADCVDKILKCLHT